MIRMRSIGLLASLLWVIGFLIGANFLLCIRVQMGWPILRVGEVVMVWVLAPRC